MISDDLTKRLQSESGFPWYNGEAYARFVGYSRQAARMRSAVDDLDDVIEWLREERLYPQSDRLRVIRNRLNDGISLARADLHKKF